MVKLSEFNVHYLLIDDEPKHTKIGLNYQLSYENKNPVIQLPKGVIKHLRANVDGAIDFRVRDSIVTISLDPLAMDSLREIQTKLIYKASSVYPTTEFKPFVDNDLMVKIVPETRCFDFTRKEIPKSSIEEGMEVVVLMETKGMWVTKVSSTLMWTVKQIMITS